MTRTSNPFLIPDPFDLVEAHAGRKKPCPYCGKKLQCVNRHKWRNNLARHLGNACPPYEKEVIQMSLRLMGSLVGSIAEYAVTGKLSEFRSPDFKSPEQILKEQSEIKALEALFKLKSVPTKL